jgi:hypothetical protein
MRQEVKRLASPGRGAESVPNDSGTIRDRCVPLVDARLVIAGRREAHLDRFVRARHCVLVAIVWLVAGCAGSNGLSPSASAVAATSPSATPAPEPGTPSPDASAEITLIPGCLPSCGPRGLIRPGDLPAGDYTTQHFFGGQFTVTVPDGWTSFEDSTGEFALRPLDVEGTALLFWLDVYPIVDGTTTPVPGIEPTADGVIGWIEENPNLEVIERREATLGGLRARALDLGRAADAVNVDPGCPAEVSPCVGLFGFPQWEGFFSEGGPFHLRLIMAQATWGGEEHVIYAMIDAASEDAFAAMAPASVAIIEGARLPLGISQ